MIYEVKIGERLRQISVTASGDAWLVQVDGGPTQRVEGGRRGAAEWLLWIGGAKRVLGLHLDKDRFSAQVRGHAVRGEVQDPRSKALELGAGAGQGQVRTPVPGAVVRIPVSVGQAVHKGQVLIVVEAMKMENEFKSPIDGVVSEIKVQAGTPVEANALLLVVE